MTNPSKSYSVSMDDPPALSVTYRWRFTLTRSEIARLEEAQNQSPREFRRIADKIAQERTR